MGQSFVYTSTYIDKIDIGIVNRSFLTNLQQTYGL